MIDACRTQLIYGFKKNIVQEVSQFSHPPAKTDYLGVSKQEQISVEQFFSEFLLEENLLSSQLS